MNQEHDLFGDLKRMRAYIAELKIQRTRLKEIIARSPQNELQREAIKMGQELLKKLDNVLSVLERTN